MKAALEREKEARAKDASVVRELAEEEDEEELLELAALKMEEDPEWMKKVSRKTLEKFHGLIAGGVLEGAFQQWVPWWHRDTLTPKIELVNEGEEEKDGEEGEEEQEEKDEPFTGEPSPSPHILSHIPTIASLTKINPSPLLANNVVEVLYSYVYAKLTFNGDWEDENASEALDIVIAISSVLSENAVYKDLAEACRRPLETSLSHPETRSSPAFSFSVLREMITLLSKGHLFVLAALSDLHYTFLHVLSLQASNPSPSSRKPLKGHATPSQMQKKLLFFISWTHERGSEMIPSLLLGVRSFLSNYQISPETSFQPNQTSDFIASMTQTKGSDTFDAHKMHKIEMLD